MRKRLRAFTLIELLIVVAIIAILAAIAVPNFLEAQTRSKVSRAKADLRSLATACEAYQVDWNAYPPNSADDPIVLLSTPVAFMTSARLRDPFGDRTESTGQDDYFYFATAETDSVSFFLLDVAIQLNLFSMDIRNEIERGKFYLASRGPDQISEITRLGIEMGNSGLGLAEALRQFYEDSNGMYDPTNGTISGGDIIRTGVGQYN
jgi:prepilin-type N-terminal cleavage/methylation domain-containing protein